MGALTQARSMEGIRWSKGKCAGWVGEHKGAAIGFHQRPRFPPPASRLPQAFAALANKECHCVLPAPQMNIVKLAPLLDLQSNTGESCCGVWSI